MICLSGERRPFHSTLNPNDLFGGAGDDTLIAGNWFGRGGGRPLTISTVVRETTDSSLDKRFRHSLMSELSYDRRRWQRHLCIQ